MSIYSSRVAINYNVHHSEVTHCNSVTHLWVFNSAWTTRELYDTEE